MYSKYPVFHVLDMLTCQASMWADEAGGAGEIVVTNGTPVRPLPYPVQSGSFPFFNFLVTAVAPAPVCRG